MVRKIERDGGGYRHRAEWRRFDGFRVRGRGLFARSCMKSQMASPAFTHVFAALVAVVNTKFPELGELLLKRIILQLRRAFKRNDKVCPLTLVHRVSRKICL